MSASEASGGSSSIIEGFTHILHRERLDIVSETELSFNKENSTPSASPLATPKTLILNVAAEATPATTRKDRFIDNITHSSNSNSIARQFTPKTLIQEVAASSGKRPRVGISALVDSSVLSAGDPHLGSLSLSDDLGSNKEESSVTAGPEIVSEREVSLSTIDTSAESHKSTQRQQEQSQQQAQEEQPQRQQQQEEEQQQHGYAAGDLSFDILPDILGRVSEVENIDSSTDSSMSLYSARKRLGVPIEDENSAAAAASPQRSASLRLNAENSPSLRSPVQGPVSGDASLNRSNSTSISQLAHDPSRPQIHHQIMLLEQYVKDLHASQHLSMQETSSQNLSAINTSQSNELEFRRYRTQMEIDELQSEIRMLKSELLLSEAMRQNAEGHLLSTSVDANHTMDLGNPQSSILNMINWVQEDATAPSLGGSSSSSLGGMAFQSPAPIPPRGGSAGGGHALFRTASAAGAPAPQGAFPLFRMPSAVAHEPPTPPAASSGSGGAFPLRRMASAAHHVQPMLLPLQTVGAQNVASPAEPSSGGAFPLRRMASAAHHAPPTLMAHALPAAPRQPQQQQTPFRHMVSADAIQREIQEKEHLIEKLQRKLSRAETMRDSRNLERSGSVEPADLAAPEMGAGPVAEPEPAVDFRQSPTSRVNESLASVDDADTSYLANSISTIEQELTDLRRRQMSLLQQTPHSGAGGSAAGAMHGAAELHHSGISTPGAPATNVSGFAIEHDQDQDRDDAEHASAHDSSQMPMQPQGSPTVSTLNAAKLRLARGSGLRFSSIGSPTHGTPSLTIARAQTGLTPLTTPREGLVQHYRGAPATSAAPLAASSPDHAPGEWPTGSYSEATEDADEQGDEESSIVDRAAGDSERSHGSTARVRRRIESTGSTGDNGISASEAIDGIMKQLEMQSRENAHIQKQLSQVSTHLQTMAAQQGDFLVASQTQQQLSRQQLLSQRRLGGSFVLFAGLIVFVSLLWALSRQFGVSFQLNEQGYRRPT